MSYAVIRLGGKQYRVAEGQRLLVERLPHEEGKTFHPETLLVAGDGSVDLEPKGSIVTARLVGHVLGDKVRIGKYKRRTGYKRHNGHRSRLSQIEIESVGAKRATRESAPKAEAATEKAAPEVKAVKQVKAAKAPAKKTAATAEKKAAAKPAAEKKAAAKPTAEKKAPARKPAATKKKDA
jgi:large subunit ribosomal protein L21